ncbi:hypothetical protein DES53_107299 [Roseimicrobium gellanilyticum]|uniref:Uncharacterized protein n=1 Tax=Roseimicrobium gellanilyticum TaxID=748857 RepID=A0A366HG08_9BACT|nr:hypothetical protein [Roseimicrobium gellanilyticum]RBP41467.1 hypothetical protein DES53_107299 [Roseimicrobium gellanilyticum]
MKINLTKLTNVEKKEDGRIVARCPACAANDADRKGNNLVVFPDGRFACAAFSGDKAHNQSILQLLGQKGGKPSCKFPIKRLVIPDSGVLLKIGTIGESAPEQGSRENSVPQTG